MLQRICKSLSLSKAKDGTIAGKTEPLLGFFKIWYNAHMNTPITRTSILISAPLEKVWDAITKPEIVKQYFFGTNLETTWEVGTPILFKGEWEGKEYVDKGIVQSYVPQKSLSYTYRSSTETGPDVPESYKLISYEVMPRDAGVELSICQTAETEEQAKHSEENWNTVLHAMKDLLEHK